MICRATRRGSTGIVPGYDWKEPVRECHRPRNDFLSLHNSKRVSTQAPRLLTIVGLAGRRAGEAMCATIRLGAMLPEVPAADVEDTIDEQITALSPQRSERNILDVPQQPGGLVIQ